MSRDDLQSQQYRLDPGVGHRGIAPEGCLGWVAIVFSPFIGFAIHGSVEGEALAFAILPLLVGAALVIHARVGLWRERQKLPKEVREQARLGKVLPPFHATETSLNEIRYCAARNNTGEVLLNESGVWISQKAFLQASFGLAKEVASAISAAQATPVDYIHQVEWGAIDEWHVKDAWSDTPPHYELVYRNRQHVSVLRPLDRSVEPQLLDYVRSAGQCPVRLFANAGR